MTSFQVAYNQNTKVATVQTKGDALPAGSSKAGEFVHDHATADQLGKPDAENHVLFHHVRDVLYKIGVLDMQSVDIQLDVDYIALTSFTLTPATVTLAVNATQQLTPAFTPGTASNKKITYTTSDAAKATVSASGLITAKQSGSATITATAEDGGSTKTCVVTIS